MSALPESQFAFRVGESVRVIRNGADKGMTGVVVRLLASGDYLVEFNHVDQQIYRGQDLVSNPKAAVKIPMV